MEWIRELFHWVEALAETPYATWALIGVSFAESSFFPVPPDALLIALCVARPERALWYALVCSIASVLGGVAGYAIGWAGVAAPTPRAPCHPFSGRCTRACAVRVGSPAAASRDRALATVVASYSMQNAHATKIPDLFRVGWWSKQVLHR